MTFRLSALYLYPVKGFASVAVDEAQVTARGFARDRRFMVVDLDGVFITQRDLPRMATVWTEIEGDTLQIGRAHV